MLCINTRYSSGIPVANNDYTHTHSNIHCSSNNMSVGGKLNEPRSVGASVEEKTNHILLYINYQLDALTIIYS